MPGGLGPQVVDENCKGLSPFPFIPFGYLSYSFPKVLKNESVGVWGGGILVASQHPPKGKCLTSLPM